MKILLIEDEKITRLTLAETLRDEGHDVETCADGNEGMEAVKKADYHVILCDLRLPGPSGIDILAFAKEKNKDHVETICKPFFTLQLQRQKIYIKNWVKLEILGVGLN